MQENKEYHRTGIAEAIAEDAIHIMEGDEAIVTIRRKATG